MFKKVFLNTALAFCEMIKFILAVLAHLSRCLAGMLLNKTCKVGCAAKIQMCLEVFGRLFCVDQSSLGLMQ